jgi:hypothetical protein
VGVALLAAACSRGDDARARDSAAARQTRAGSLAFAATPYQPRDVTDGGRVSGTVQLDGDVPPDSVITPISDQRVCGQTVTERPIEVNGKSIAGVVVWLDGLRAGKPLPETRRFELSNEHCELTPRVQATLSGGTLNVRNSDRIAHRARFVRRGTDETVALLRHYDEGEVVPSETVLSRPGIVEVRCDLHPWTRAWVAVFDHPYYAVTERDGKFSFDMVPPGKYRLVAWHPRLGEIEQDVEISAGGSIDKPVTLKAR